jgi:hypothetical protein
MSTMSVLSNTIVSQYSNCTMIYQLWNWKANLNWNLYFLVTAFNLSHANFIWLAKIHFFLFVYIHNSDIIFSDEMSLLLKCQITDRQENYIFYWLCKTSKLFIGDQWMRDFICSMGKDKQILSCDYFFHKFGTVLFGLQKVKWLNKNICGSDTGSDCIEMSGLTWIKCSIKI